MCKWHKTNEGWRLDWDEESGVLYLSPVALVGWWVHCDEYKAGKVFEVVNVEIVKRLAIDWLIEQNNLKIRSLLKLNGSL